MSVQRQLFRCYADTWLMRRSASIDGVRATRRPPAAPTAQTRGQHTAPQHVTTRHPRDPHHHADSVPRDWRTPWQAVRNQWLGVAVRFHGPLTLLQATATLHPEALTIVGSHVLAKALTTTASFVVASTTPLAADALVKEPQDFSTPCGATVHCTTDDNDRLHITITLPKTMDHGSLEGMERILIIYTHYFHPHASFQTGPDNRRNVIEGVAQPRRGSPRISPIGLFSRYAAALATAEPNAYLHADLAARVTRGAETIGPSLFQRVRRDFKTRVILEHFDAAYAQWLEQHTLSRISSAEDRPRSLNDLQPLVATALAALSDTSAAMETRLAACADVVHGAAALLDLTPRHAAHAVVTDETLEATVAAAFGPDDYDTVFASFTMHQEIDIPPTVRRTVMLRALQVKGSIAKRSIWINRIRSRLGTYVRWRKEIRSGVTRARLPMAESPLLRERLVTRLHYYYQDGNSLNGLTARGTIKKWLASGILAHKQGATRRDPREPEVQRCVDAKFGLGAYDDAIAAFSVHQRERIPSVVLVTLIQRTYNTDSSFSAAQWHAVQLRNQVTTFCSWRRALRTEITRRVRDRRHHDELTRAVTQAFIRTYYREDRTLQGARMSLEVPKLVTATAAELRIHINKTGA
jgi:hypothetical protein